MGFGKIPLKMSTIRFLHVADSLSTLVKGNKGIFVWAT
jgi:hypothetical protein